MKILGRLPLVVPMCLLMFAAGTAHAQTDNTATGVQALNSNTTGDYNTADGARALFSNTSGSFNTATGRRSLYYNSSGYYNTATGATALYRNNGCCNSAFGSGALQENTDGVRNTAVGNAALFANTGNQNSAVGSNALVNNTTGSYNTAVGASSLDESTSASNNTAVGFHTLGALTNGSGNTAMGMEALEHLATGTENTAIGAGALDASVYGVGNVAIGFGAMGGSISDVNHNLNTAVGYSAGPTAAMYNTGAFGNAAVPTASNTIRIGNGSITSIGGAVAWSNLSDARFKTNVKGDVPGLEFISQLRPVTFTWDLEKLDGPMPSLGPIDEAERFSRASKVHTGFLAQEVEAAAKRCRFDFSGIVKPANAESRYELQYSQFVVPLVRAVQEQQKEIEELRMAVQRLSRPSGYRPASILGNVWAIGIAALGVVLGLLLRFKRGASPGR